MNVMSAPAGTHLWHRDHGRIAVIIGFAHVQGALGFPLYAIANAPKGLGPMHAIEHPDGYVSYPAGDRQTFDSVDDWKSYVEDLEWDEADPAAAAGSTVDAKPGDSNRPLVFGTKSHKTKSFWHWADANAVFEIEGEQPYPNDPRVLKIKRDEYFNLKRDGASKIDPHAGTIEDEEEPETPAAEDEDDVSDLI